MSEQKLPSDTGILKFFLKDSAAKEIGGAREWLRVYFS